MGDLNQEPSSSITWMLHSAEINDSALAEALVIEFYEGVIAFAMSVSGNPDLAKSAGQAAIIQAVTGRHRFWGETSLRAWLYRLAYLYLQKNVIQDRQSPSRQALVAQKRMPRKYAPIPADHPSLSLRDPLPFWLYYGHGFTEAEIVYVLEKELSQLLFSLNQDRFHLFSAKHSSGLPSENHIRFIDLSCLAQMGLLDINGQLELEQHLADCRLCQAYRNQLPRLEESWKEELKPPAIGTAQVRVALRHITAILSKKTNGPKYLLPFKELSLVVTLVFLLLLFGRTQGVFEANDTRHPITTLPTSTPNPTRTPLPTPTPAPRPFELYGYEGDDFFYFDTWIVDGDTWKSIAEKAGLREDLVRYLNPSLPEELSRSTRIKLAGLKSSSLFQVTQTAQASPDLLPLGSSSSPEEILQRARLSNQNWDTLFVDQIFIDFGPPGYSGPALQTSRTQLLVSQPDHWISIQGEPDRHVNIVTYAAGDWIFRRTPRHGRISAIWKPGGLDGSSSPIPAADLPQEGTYVNAGLDTVATRPAIILDSFNEAGWRQQRLWFDAFAGTLLKYEIFTGPPEEIVLQSFVVLEIYFDIPLPDDFFFPPSSSYLQYTSRRVIDSQQLVFDRFGTYPQRPVPTTKIIPPVGFEPAQNPLQLEFPFSSIGDVGPAANQIFYYSETREESLKEENLQPEKSIQVFSGDYYLGELELESTQFRTCVRSPDGQIVALLTSIDLSRSRLSWFDLDTLESNFVTELAGGSTEFAFSPNSQKLAYANCRMGCGVTVLDLDSGEVTTPGPVYDWVSYLEWSPDGSQLAYMTFRWPLAPRVHVIDLEAGAEIHIAGYDLETDQPLEAGSPIETWGVPYPSPQTDPGCRYP